MLKCVKAIVDGGNLAPTCITYTLEVTAFRGILPGARHLEPHMPLYVLICPSIHIFPDVSPLCSGTYFSDAVICPQYIPIHPFHIYIYNIHIYTHIYIYIYIYIYTCTHRMAFGGHYRPLSGPGTVLGQAQQTSVQRQGLGLGV